MNSFWIDNFKNKHFESLDQNLKTDVCIIGGGITGISCGYYLSRAGLNVCILEKDKINLPVKNIKIALEFSHQAQFNPIKYALSLCDCITKNKGIIFENSKVVGLKKSGNEYNINCNNHLVTAKYVIIATRYPIINFPGFYFLKMYPNSKVLYKWNTHDSISLDKLPYIGDFSNLYPNVYVATGFKKWGMTTSNVAANIISDKILKKGNAYADIYKATRLKPIKNRKELGNIIKETSHSLIFNKFDLPSATPKDVKNDDGKIINYKRKKDWIIQK
jgi:glycine/D-amino acid oxidase-like deaminating enzyme